MQQERDSLKNEFIPNGFHTNTYEKNKPPLKWTGIQLSNAKLIRSPKKSPKILDPESDKNNCDKTEDKAQWIKHEMDSGLGLSENTQFRPETSEIRATFGRPRFNLNLHRTVLSPDNAEPIEKCDKADDKAERIMQKMGYKPGFGLGKNKQGITETIAISPNLGKRGFGLKVEGLDKTSETWDFDQETIVVAEKINWLKISEEDIPNFQKENFKDWIKEDVPNHKVTEHVCFCDADVVRDVFKAKDIFDELDIHELNKARARANPYESIRAVFFMNRAALKMANIDAACEFMFTNMETNEPFSKEEGPIYFADVCAGPGGFTEYILWRKKWLYKGFGLTLKDENDFRISKSSCASGVTFQPLYGKDETGNVCNPDNLRDFTERVKHESENKGLHFMMSDGGFCVEKQENLQEILSKNIYLCQCLLALNVLREHGCFVTKLFDIFTPFSGGLLYLMHLCFEKVGIIKPNSSRPANSERYFVCSNLRFSHQTSIIRDYLWLVAERLWKIRYMPKTDILELVPIDVIQKDKRFFDYIYESNKSIAKKQIVALKKLTLFCRNPSLEETRQEILRNECLQYWAIPDNRKRSDEIDTPSRVLNKVRGLKYEEFNYSMPKIISDNEGLSAITCVDEWLYCYMNSTIENNKATFFTGTDSAKSFCLKNKWEPINHLALVKDTLIFGEIVPEKSTLQNGEKLCRDSLHVIDALRLGSVNLERFSFADRQKQIRIYCKAVNKESEQKYAIRVRPKPLKPLKELPYDVSLARRDNFIRLPELGFQVLSDTYPVFSVLLIKANKAENTKSSSTKNTFQSMFMQRIQISITKDQPGVTIGDLKEYVSELPR